MQKILYCFSASLSNAFLKKLEKTGEFLPLAAFLQKRLAAANAFSLQADKIVLKLFHYRQRGRTAIKEFVIGKNDAGQRLDRFLAKAVPLLPASLLQKYIRLKRVKCNGTRAQRDVRLAEGDVLTLYINDEFFDTPNADNAYLTVNVPKLTIVYEDENLLLADKKPGQAVHPHDGAEYGKTLIDHIQAYLYAKGEWRPREEAAFAPALCNRIDRNTGGLVIAAKNAEALRILNQKIRDREIDKYYLAILHGKMQPADGQLSNYIFKDAKQNRVYVTDAMQKGAKTAVTRYRTLAVRDSLSLVECELLTGRTHQIRAQFSHAGHPLLGDGKYGKLQKEDGRSFQALCSYRLRFSFPTDAGILNYLRGKSFQVAEVDFVKEYFP